MIRQLDIKPGSLVVVTADVTRLALAGRRVEPPFEINNFIDTIKQVAGKGGTLVIPSFNFNLRNNDRFSPTKSIPVTGALAVAAMKRPEFVRTFNPLHSFLAWGDHAAELASLSNKSSFAADSPFAFFRKHKGVMLLIDTSITDAFTFVHHVEEMEGVRYRKFRKMNIMIGDETVRREEDKTVRREVVLYAKKRGWTMDLSGLERLLIEKNAARKIMINKVVFTLVDLNLSYDIICDDIRKNNARNIARFSYNIYLRETAKNILGAFGFHTLADKISHDPGLL